MEVNELDKKKKEKEFKIINIDKILDLIYSKLIKLTERKFKGLLKSYESGLDQLYFKWFFSDGKELIMTFKINRENECPICKKKYLTSLKICPECNIDFNKLP